MERINRKWLLHCRMQVRIDRPATPPLQGLAAGTLDPAGLASNRGSHQLLPSGNNTVSDLSLLAHLLRIYSCFPSLFSAGMAWQFAQPLSTSYSSVWRTYGELFPHSHHLSSPIQQRLPGFSCQGPSAATKALDGQYGTPSTSPPTPPQSRFKHHRRVCGTVYVRWDSNSPSARAQLPVPGLGTKHYRTPSQPFSPRKYLLGLRGSKSAA
jgi:hypothetical protein